MPRREVRFVAGKVYHVFNRGVERSPIFPEPENYDYFTRLLKAKTEKHGVRLIAYCLMPSHFHLLLRPDRDGAVAPMMAGLGSSYAQALNVRRRRVGPLFQGRFRSTHVDRDGYLAHVARYIHLNPVMAGLVTRPLDWRYSNYGDLGEDGVLIGGIFPDAAAYRRFAEAPQAFELPGSLELPGS